MICKHVIMVAARSCCGHLSESFMTTPDLNAQDVSVIRVMTITNTQDISVYEFSLRPRRFCEFRWVCQREDVLRTRWLTTL